MTHENHIAIIGAGPAGLMAAQALAESGKNITIYDHMPSPGRKLLMAGRGGLNLTHSEPLEAFLTRYGAAADWLAPCIHAFPPEALRAWCEALGEATFIGSSGRVFPRSMKAAPLLRAWLRRLEGLGVRFALRHRWLGWEGDALLFSNAAKQPVLIKTQATLLALGGASWPRLGSDGGWVNILAAQGIALSQLRPSNCGFTVAWSDYFSSRFAGMPLKPVGLTHNTVAKQGEMMLTKQGIEGGAVYALSSALRDTLASEGKAVLQLDLRPGMASETLADKLQPTRGGQSLSSTLKKAGFSSLAVSLLHEVTPRAELAAMPPARLAERLKNLPLTLTGTAGMARAISTAGGVAREAVTDDFMLRAKKGVFVAGEMLDWEAPTGGYLLQACFSTAMAAARGIGAYVKQ